jgi:putative transposase
MKPNTTSPDDNGFRFPPEIISYAVWRYFRFSLSFRDSEELMAQRGVALTSETIRQWLPSVQSLRGETHEGW